MEIEEIIKTLPIGYYLGYRFDVFLSDSKKSKIDYENKALIISKKELREQLQRIQVKNKAEAIRTAFYHLIAHIMLTPAGIFSKKGYLHTFEDERVESLLKNYFLGINFKEAVKEQSKKDFARFDALWYSIIRLRKGPLNFVKQVHDLIRKYPTIHKKQLYENYLIDVEKFYQQVYKWWKDTYKPTIIPVENGISLTYDIKLPDSVIDQIMSDLRANCTDDSEIGGFIDQIAEVEKKESETLSTSSIESLKYMILTKAKEGGKSVTPSLIKGLPAKIQKSSLMLYDKLRYFVELPIRLAGKKGNSTPAYSGTLSPRNCDRDDYKFFVIPNPLGSTKKFKDKHLNLFLDCSGSFTGSAQVNGFLEVLQKIEKRYPQFSYSVILCSERETIMPKNDRLHYPGYNGGGTQLTTEIFSIYDIVQKRNAQNFNIVMYDGYCNASCKFNKYENCFQAFNHSNVALIAESSNIKQLKKYCPKAFKIFVRGEQAEEEFYYHTDESQLYVEKIEENIITAFALLFS